MTTDRRGKIKITEKMTRRQICSFFKTMGIKWWWNLQALGAKRGLPDLEGVHKGKHFYVEVKAPNGKLSENQEQFKQMVEEEGELVIVAHDFDEFIWEWGEFTKY